MSDIDIMSLNSYFNPVETVFGIKAVDKLAIYVKKYSLNERILIVSDKDLLDILEIRNKLTSTLENDNFNVEFFEKDSYFSSISIIDHGAKYVRGEKFGLIIGIGGGSAMDTAKCMAILGQNPGSLNLYVKQGKQLENYGIPLIEVPTTAGTGSEVTKWATVWDLGEYKKKYSLSDEKMYAKAAIVDPELIKSLPPKMSAMTGLDALSQAIEAYWSRNHNPVSDIYALEAIKIIFFNLVNSYHNPQNIDYREQMALGSMFSGLAFSNTKTTAVHSVSYPMTLHFNVAHGHACALTLGQFIIFNSKIHPSNIDETPNRIKKIVNILGVNSSVEAAEVIKRMMEEMGLATKLNELNIDEKGIDLIIKEGFTPDRVKHNPRLVTEEDLRKILLNIK